MNMSQTMPNRNLAVSRITPIPYCVHYLGRRLSMHSFNPIKLYYRMHG